MAFTEDDINENSRNVCYINCTPGEVKQQKPLGNFSNLRGSIYSIMGCLRHI